MSLEKLITHYSKLKTSKTMKTLFNFKQTGKTTGVLLAGLLLGWVFFGGSHSDQPATIDEHVQEAHTDEQGNIVYTCSMHPSVRESEPGNCPICGMELIPVNSESTTDEDNPYQLTMTEAAMKLAEVQTSEVVRDVAVNTIRMPGKIAVDERRIRSLPAHYPGRIEELYVNFTGEYITKGEKVASIYSPALVSAQKELLETAKYKEQNPTLYQAARTKLFNWKIPESQINEIETSGEIKTRFDIISHMGGYVIKRNIAVGDHVEMGTVIYQMADLSNVWVTFNAYESDLTGLDVGDQVSFTVDSYPGETFRAEITYIDPILDPQSRTAKVRAEAANPNGKLKPQMLAEGVISSRVEGGSEQLLIPKSAVLWTGERSVVYVKKPDTERPVFEFREVVLGQRVGDHYIVKSGVEAGEEVVTNGNFKIDSAAQLAGKASMMNREPGSRKSSAMPGMEGMDMGTPDRKIEKRPSSQKPGQEHNFESFNRETVPDAFRKQLDRLADPYLGAKDALTNGNLQSASSAMTRFKEVLSHIDMNLIKDNEQMQAWMTRQQALRKHTEAVLQTGQLDAFRKQFALLSEALVKTFTMFGIERELFVQFCPMARDGEGAYWVSSQSAIVNPYMEEKMPGCGEITEELNLGS